MTPPRADMKEFTQELRELTAGIHALDLRLATIDEWMKNADKDINECGKTLYGSNGNDGLEMKVDRLSGRVAIVFAVGAGGWALFTIVFSIIAANLWERLSLLAH